MPAHKREAFFEALIRTILACRKLCKGLLRENLRNAMAVSTDSGETHMAQLMVACVTRAGFNGFTSNFFYCYTPVHRQARDKREIH